MGQDERNSVAPASLTAETELIDESWDDEEDVELEVLPAEDSLAPGSSAAAEFGLDPESHDRPTPFLGEEILESGFHEREPATAPCDDLSPPRPPVIPPPGPPSLELDLGEPRPRRLPSAQLDDPLRDVDHDLDTETRSSHPLPIEQRVTPVQETPAELFELDLTPPPAAAPEADPAVRDMKERYAVGDFTGALVIAESVLETDPEDLEARRYAQSCRDVLMQMYAARLGALTQVVTVAIPSDQIRWLSLDHRAGFLLSLVDGTSSVEELLDICGMPRLDALRILYMLLEQRVIALEQ